MDVYAAYCVDEDIRLKSSRVDNRVVLEELIAQLRLAAEGGIRR